MRLVATYDLHYGPCGPNDAEAPLVLRGEEFVVRATFQASADEVSRFLIRAGAAVTPEMWSRRKPVSDANWRWAKEQTEKGRAAYLNRKSARGA